MSPLYWVRVAYLSQYLPDKAAVELLTPEDAKKEFVRLLIIAVQSDPGLEDLFEPGEEAPESDTMPDYVLDSITRTSQATVSAVCLIEESARPATRGLNLLLLHTDLALHAFGQKHVSRFVSRQQWETDGAIDACRLHNPLTGWEYYWRLHSRQAKPNSMSVEQSRTFRREAIVARNLANKSARAFNLVKQGNYTDELDAMLCDDVMTAVTLENLSRRDARTAEGFRTSQGAKGKKSTVFDEHKRDKIVARFFEIRKTVSSDNKAAEAVRGEMLVPKLFSTAFKKPPSVSWICKQARAARPK